MFSIEQIKDTAREYAYSLQSKDMAMSLGCETIEDVEYQEMIGALPAGTADSLSMYGDMPSFLEKQRLTALRDFLFVENDYITEEQLADSYTYPQLLRDCLSQQDPEVVSEYLLFEAEALAPLMEEDEDDSDLY
jgi:hypothetical protein